MAETILYHGKFYVYEWLSVEGECLYIGKGTGKRAWDTRRGRHTSGAIRIRILLWIDDGRDAFYYERKLILAFKPKWNILIPKESTSLPIPTMPWVGDEYVPRKIYRTQRERVIASGVRPLLREGIWDCRTFLSPDGEHCHMPHIGLLKVALALANSGYWGQFPIARHSRAGL